MPASPTRYTYATCATCTRTSAPPTSKEYAAVAFLFLLALLSIALPPLAQPEAYHQFADQRTFLGIAHAADVLTNLVFLCVGAFGLMRLSVKPNVDSTTRKSLAVFFLGVLATAAGSAYYHWAPDSQSLLWDRGPMVVAFAGLVGAFCAQRISSRAGKAALVATLALGAASLAQAATSGSVTAYAVLQFGGLLGMVLMLAYDGYAGRASTAPAASMHDTFAWRTLLCWYALAKLLEMGDTAVWELTSHWVSGHSLKHLAAGVAALAVARAIALRPATPKFVA
jgi:hypothetical protein